MEISRVWAMPSKDTFTIKPIGNFVDKYLKTSSVSIDPFARNSGLATFTNDLNPDTNSMYHMYAKDFLKTLVELGVKADLIIFDPPYSMVQAKRSYESYGEWTYQDTLEVGRWFKEKDLCDKLLTDDGVFLHFGWHTNGIGKKRGFEIVELLIVAHGGAHNDTLCLAEKRKNDKKVS